MRRIGEMREKIYLNLPHLPRASPPSPSSLKGRFDGSDRIFEHLAAIPWFNEVTRGSGSAPSLR